MTAPVLCLGCGAEFVTGSPQPTNCTSCPDADCFNCGGVNRWSVSEFCSCWESAETLADAKAVFSDDGTFNVDTDGKLSIA